MKLYYSPASPYARKARITAKECGIRLDLQRVDPRADGTGFGAVNPLQRIPALVLDDGLVLFDSPVICEYLDSLHPGDKLFPAAGPDRWRALLLQAAGDGVLDAAVPRRAEKLRPAAQQSPEQLYRYERSMRQGLDWLEQQAATFDGLTIGTITIACVLGYLDFRFPDDHWRQARPALAAWFADFAKRPSVAETDPTIA